MIAEQLPPPAIRPYPTQHVAPWTLKNGVSVTVRPIRPEDEPLMVRFHETLSEQSVYFRYFHVINLSERVAHERLIRICFIDYDQEIALVAEHRDPRTSPEGSSGERQIVAVGRLSKRRGTEEAEFALLISDAFQHQGLGTELLRRLLQVARDEKRRRVTAEILPDNRAMQHVCEKLGFRLRYDLREQVIKAEIDL